MRILVDENGSGALVGELRWRGHDVLWAAETHKGASDAELLVVARNQERIIVTNDLDFGMMAIEGHLLSGVMVLRLEDVGPPRAARLVASVLERRQDWTGLLAVVQPGRVRMRRLPG